MLRKSSALGVIVMGLFWAGIRPAEAQPLRPNILIIFDTSTSMLATGNDGLKKDGSPLCLNEGQNSRLFRLKQAIRETLTEVGTDEANFGLARFPQIVTPGTDRGCFRGHYINSDDYLDSATRCGTTVNPETPDGNWFVPNVAYEFIAVPVTNPAAGLPPQTTNYDPVGANLTLIHTWLDNVETSNGTVMTNPEIRSGGSGTPLSGSIFYARLYFDKYVRPNDPKKNCRKNITLLVTDGAQSCSLTTEAAVAQAVLHYDAGYDLYVITDTSTGSRNDTIARGGSGNTRDAVRVDFTDPVATKKALINIIAEAVPPTEICNGKDDNCNDQIDEAPLPGVGDQCLCPGLVDSNIGKGTCKKGVTVCKSTAPAMASIVCEGCVLPGTETCNGLDDDCDGEIDEDFKVPGRDLGKSCDNGLDGVCVRTGNVLCTPDGTGVFCDAPKDVIGSAESCNGLDDNCDGRVDEMPLPGTGEPCGANLGECRAGTIKCLGGKFVCEGADVAGTKEICNAKDDDCNGIVDENIAGVGGVCACASYPLMTLMTGECKPGKSVCKGREPLDCEGCVVPRPEICDGLDNNCDGKTDEDNPCTTGRICLGGKCQILCKQDEFPCPSGYNCNRTASPPVCESTKCANVSCEPGMECDPGSGQCKDLCAGVVCQAPKVCRLGRCQDCYTLGCTSGELCINGKCQENPCANKSCAEGHYCDEQGECVALCRPSCAGDERCVRGTCQKDPCAASSAPLCGQSEVCDPANGQCKPNLCKLSGRTCPGQTCVPVTGDCKDNPCATVACGLCSRCEMAADGLPLCVDLAAAECEAHETRIQVKGGGCNCTAGARETPVGTLGAALLLVGLVLALRRVRK